MKILKQTETKNGNKIELVGSVNHKNILVIGVFHGDEPQGKYIIDEYLKKESPLLFIPCLNPDGMQKNIRTNANGVDLNRNFPTENWGKNEGENATCDDSTTLYYGGTAPASEIETRFVTEVLEEYKPEIILTIHAPYKVVNYDGPAKKTAEIISSIIKYPVEASIGYPTPGSFGTYAGVERGIQTITLELDETIPAEELCVPVHKIFDCLCNDL